jgi:hypothetical protein
MKKRTIALERNAKVFGGNVFTAAPLVCEIGAFLGENLSKTLHGRCDESVRLSTARRGSSTNAVCTPFQRFRKSSSSLLENSGVPSLA